jgi:DNA-binding response OmpR family regulator
MFDPILCGKRVLVVDDLPAMADLLVEVFSDWGAAVDHAVTGADARRKLQLGTYDLVVTDLYLEDMLGTELARPVAGRPSTSPAIVILTAARSGPWPASHLARQLGLPVLFKPFDLDELRRVSRRSVARQAKACA